jgi:hypothetical protein
VGVSAMRAVLSTSARALAANAHHKTTIAKTPPLLDEANLPMRIGAPLRAPTETGQILTS